MVSAVCWTCKGSQYYGDGMPMLIWRGMVGVIRFCVVWDCRRDRCGDLLESQCRFCLCCVAGIAAEIAFGGFPGIAVRCRVLGVCSMVVGIAVDRLVGISWNRSIVCCCWVSVRLFRYSCHRLSGPHASIKAGSWPPVVPPCQWIRSGRAAAGGPRLSPNLAVTPFWGALGGAGLAKVVARALLGPGLALGTRWCFRQGYPNQGRYKLWLGGAGVVWRWRARASFTWVSAGLCTCWGSDC